VFLNRRVVEDLERVVEFFQKIQKSLTNERQRVEDIFSQNYYKSNTKISLEVELLFLVEEGLNRFNGLLIGQGLLFL